MKKKTSGNRFNKSTTISLDENDVQNPQTMIDGFGQIQEQSIAKALELSQRGAEASLSIRGLPTTVFIHQLTQADGQVKEVFTNSRPDIKLGDGFDYLPSYLATKYKLDSDSIEVLSGKILFLIHTIKSKIKTNNLDLLDVFRVGELTERLKVRMIDHKFHADRAKGDKSALTPIIRILAQKEGSHKELWSMLETHLHNIGWHPDEFEEDGMSYIDHEYADKPYSFKAFSNRISEFRNKK